MPKKQMNDMIVQKLQEMLEDDTLEEIVEQHVKKMLVNVCDKVFDWRHSKTKEVLTEKLEEQLQLSFWNIKLQNYSAHVHKIIETHLSEFVENQMTEKIKDSVSKILGVPENKEISLQDIADRLKPDNDDVCDTPQGEMTCIYRPDADSYARIYLDKDEGKDSRDCKYSITIDKQWFVVMVFINEWLRSAERMMQHYWIDAFIFSLYVHRVKIVNYDDEIDTERDFYD